MQAKPISEGWYQNSIASATQFVGKGAKLALGHLFDLADIYKRSVNGTRAQKASVGDVLKGAVIYGVFGEASTRTSGSFQQAVKMMGATDLWLANKDSTSLTKGESLADMLRTIDSYNPDLLIMRHSDVGSAELACEIMRCPYINAGNGSDQHPTQALLDIYTMECDAGGIEGKHVVLAGDLLHGRTVHSLVQIMAQHNPRTVTAVADDSLQLPEKYLEEAHKHGINVVRANELPDPRNCDIVYNTRLQEERFKGVDPEKIQAAYERTQITKRFLDGLPEHAMVMHPLPRNDEIPESVTEHPRIQMFDQAGNGLPVRMALLDRILN